jgi:poly-gamma-glutamate capsule biosynthesis protein CapA/YwtB (metallophosphatase superfamily)
MPAGVKSRLAARVRCATVASFAAVLLSAGAYQPSATIVLLGDVMLGRGVARAHADGRWQTTLQSLSPILKAADLALANLESPLDCAGAAPSGDRSLIAPLDSLEALTSAGLDILSVANNHARDVGEEGFRCTESAVSAQGLSVLDSGSILLRSIHGINIAFLAADFVSGNSSGKIQTLTDEVRRLHGEGRIVVVSLHWGMEYQAGSDDLQKSIARQLADSGADILWGHHAHTVQEISWMDNTLVLYNLGNAVFDQIFPSTAARGELVWVEADRSGVRFGASVQFNIDVPSGQTGSLQPATFRILRSPEKPGR